MSNGRGNQIAVRHHWLVQFKREYMNRDYNEDDLLEERSNLEHYIPDNKTQAEENNLRIQAINELLDRYE